MIIFKYIMITVLLIVWAQPFYTLTNIYLYLIIVYAIGERSQNGDVVVNAMNNPVLVAELTNLYLKYEDALCNNKLEILDELFWNAPEVVRFGITENLYVGDEIRKFLNSRPDFKIDRQIYNLQVVTFGNEGAAVTLEFRRIIDGVERLGRQSQMWHYFPEGWKIVSAHVSLLPI